MPYRICNDKRNSTVPISLRRETPWRAVLLASELSLRVVRDVYITQPRRMVVWREAELTHAEDAMIDLHKTWSTRVHVQSLLHPEDPRVDRLNWQLR